MIKRVVARSGSRTVILIDSISNVDPSDAGQIMVSGSHGGVSSGEFACRHPLAAVFFNDAGIGKEDAGIAALGMLDRLGVPAGAVSHATARIGDAQDAWDHGVISRLNRSARAAGLKEGERLRDAATRLLDGSASGAGTT